MSSAFRDIEVPTGGSLSVAFGELASDIVDRVIPLQSDAPRQMHEIRVELWLDQQTGQSAQVDQQISKKNHTKASTNYFFVIMIVRNGFHDFHFVIATIDHSEFQ